ncbi:eukaryotic translation initiation factor 5 [Paraphysoderma sedebokerense]|nr:eukaryotic translation initiation factor 5 [Paraphysoderma sedebokerense]
MATRLLNIGGDKDDRFYRYKMPSIISKIEGKGNGIKTVIPNMSDIGKALHRPPSYPTKYFGCELGAQVKLEEKNDRYIVNGAHDAQKLQQLMEGFIQKFVLCAACGNPETDLIISRDGDIIRDCKACGQRTDVDMRHKLTTFIVKNPPDGSQETGKGKKKGKKGRKSDSKNGTPPESEMQSGDESGDDELTRQIEEAAAAMPAVKSREDDDDWAVDTSPEAVKRRQAELTNGINGIVLTDNDKENVDDGEDPFDALAEYITTSRDASNAEIMGKIDSLPTVRAVEILQFLPQVLFTPQILAQNQIEKRAPLLKKFITNEKTQRALLGGFERLVGLQHKDLLPKIAAILKVLYDEELVDEEVFLAWGEKPSKKYVGKRKIAEEILEKAKPFLDWLQTAESEEEESEEEDSEEE